MTVTTTATGATREEPTTTERPRKARFVDAVIYACYTVMAVAVLGRIWVDPDNRVPPGHEPDPNLIKWYLAYAARAVTHFENPFFTTMEGFPGGMNVIANTSLLGLGIPFTPITLTLGAGVSFVAMLTLGLAGTAAGWYYVLWRHLGVSRLAAAIGGGLCGFSPALVAHSLGHLQLSAQFLVPVIVSLVLRLREPGRLVRHGVILGLLIAYQVLIGEEILFLTALGLGLFVGVYAVIHPDQARRYGKTFLTGLGIAAGVSAVLLAYPLWMQFFGPMSYRGLDPAAQSFGAALKAYPAFATQTIFGDRAANAYLSQNYAEENSFFGWPLILLTVVLSVWMWRRRLVWVLAITSGVFALLSLSATVRTATVGGRLLTTHGPWGLFSPLPIFDAVIPTRLAMILMPAIAVVMALAIDRLRASDTSRTLRIVGFAAIAAALVTVFPTPLPGGGQSRVPRFIADGGWKPYLSEGRTLVTVPLSSPEFSSTLRWAAAADIGYAIPRGYFLAPVNGERGAQGTFWQPERYTARTLDQVARDGIVPVVTDADRREAVEDMRYWKASLVVLAADTKNVDALRTTVAALLGPGEFVRDVYLWDVRPLVG